MNKQCKILIITSFSFLAYYLNLSSLLSMFWLHKCVCVFQCQPIALLRTSGSMQDRKMELSVVYFRITHCLGKPHYVWDEYLYSVLAKVEIRVTVCVTVCVV